MKPKNGIKKQTNLVTFPCLLSHHNRRAATSVVHIRRPHPFLLLGSSWAIINNLPSENEGGSVVRQQLFLEARVIMESCTRHKYVSGDMPEPHLST